MTWRQEDYAPASASDNVPFCWILPSRLAGFGGKGIRTPDFQLAKLALYQLSYAPEKLKIVDGRWKMGKCNSGRGADVLRRDFLVLFCRWMSAIA
jgi:hypothetical protein